LNRKLVINKNFFYLWTGRIISQIGDKFYAIALAWWILVKTNSPGMMGLYMAVSMLPGIVIGLLAGPFIDRWNKKTILITSDLIRGAIVFGISLLSAFHILQIRHVVTAAIVISLSSSFFDPSIQAMLPEIVEDEKLPRANALNQMVGGFCSVIGPILGAAAVGFLGFTWVFLANGISYLVSAFFEGLIVFTPSTYKKSEKNYLGEIKSGLQFIFKQRKILVIIITIGIAHFFMGSLMVLFPFLAKELSGTGVQNLGYLEMAVGLGLLIGALFLSFKNKSNLKANYLFIFMMIAGVTFLLIGGFEYLKIQLVIPYLFIVFIFGVTIVNASIFWQSLLQTNTPKHISGRVFSVSTLIGNASLPISFGVFGFALSKISFSSLMLMSGIGLVFVSTILLFSYKNSYLKIQIKK